MCSLLWTFEQGCGRCAWSVLPSAMSEIYVNNSEFVCSLDELQMANKKCNLRLKLLRLYGRAHERKDFPGTK